MATWWKRPSWLVSMIGMLLVSMVVAGCGTGTTPASPAAATPSADGVWHVTVTTGMVGDIVKQVGGTHVEVTQLMGPGVDPHLYKASQGDIKRIDEADLVFYSGLHLEGKLVDIFEKIGRQKPVLSVTDSIPKELLHASPDGVTSYDPHVWFDVTLWMKATERVRDELIRIDPANQETYKQNTDTYLKELASLHEYAKAQIATIPKERRVLVTAHDAFGYFGKAYDIEVIGLQGISTASEYGLKDVQQLVDTLVLRQIKAVFIESSVPKRSIEAVVEGTKAKNHTITIGGELFSDAMGEPGTAEGNYIGMVRHNVDTIVKALK
ncbi:metal ABC transporter solute-binding protein, Zn/Mn family [Brevibacillus dissolubilis]|uniref:metal ABC transporter solute-binding protein, Zn/Mn family n=1 Tax=Brevibacillus dissolubilis TaxID=1844116 RepID=UPI0021003B82|nr:zinc ABC transporter substrate-binding protein [Brevibacillus dissolubilis]